MPKSKRTNVKELSKNTKDLTSDQAKRVKGGERSIHPGGVQVVMADGSVRFITDGTSNTLLTAEKK